MELIAEADRRQMATGDGCRTLVDWVAWRLDAGHDTARSYVELSRRDLPETTKLVTSGEVGFERAATRVTVANADSEADLIHRTRGLDIAGLCRHVARLRHAT